MINGEPYDINKQTIYIYIAPKSKMKSRAHYTPEPAWGPQSEEGAVWN